MRLGTWTTNTVELSGTFGDPLVARRRIAGGPQTGPHYDTTRVNDDPWVSDGVPTPTHYGDDDETDEEF